MSISSRQDGATNTIATQIYRCGPYTFTSFLPTIGLASDRERWVASVNGHPLRAEFSTLEDAMLAAVQFAKADGK